MEISSRQVLEVGKNQRVSAYWEWGLLWGGDENVCKLDRVGGFTTL